MGDSPLIDFERRGLIAQVSDREGLDAHLKSGSRTLYCGFDPSADSLQTGNLVPLLALRRFQLNGHRPIALVGGATGLIGDPSFKADERTLNDRELVESWVGRIRDQVSGFIDLDGNNAGIVVDNLDWTRELDVITFLRDVGKHFSVNSMIRKESVRARLEADGEGGWRAIKFPRDGAGILSSLVESDGLVRPGDPFTILPGGAERVDYSLPTVVLLTDVSHHQVTQAPCKTPGQ